MLNRPPHSKPRRLTEQNIIPLARRLLSAVAVLGVAAGLAGLGLWQLDRAQQKRDLHASYLRVATAPRVDLQTLDALGESTKRWRAVALTGRYLPGNVLLDNRVRRGRVGYEILTPLQRVEGPVVLVDRGWVPAPTLRSDTLVLTPPAAGVVTLAGRIAPAPSTGIALGKPQPPEVLGNALWRVQKIDFLALGASLNTPLAPYLVLLDDDQAGGYERQWPLPAADDGKHTAYAVQWFGLSAALLMLAGYYDLRRRAHPHK
ncbi:MAG: SURF1 family protein [Gammaproteobacteria bacterium]|nr:SURF1 family protein [Gammaproteobacteria bacterium]